MKLSKIIVTVLCATMLVCAIGSTVPAIAASQTPIGKNDFEIKIGKTNVNLTTCTVQEFSKAAKKKIKRDEGDRYVKASEGSFTFSVNEGFQYGQLSKKAVTARGIKIGSTHEKLLEVYPAPIETWSDKNTYFYTFCAVKNFDEFNALKNNSIEQKIAWLAIEVNVSKKTNKVIEICIANHWG